MASLGRPCLPASCCEREVDLTFDQVARIARTLELPPRAFVALTTPRPGTATLALGGAEHGLTLTRRQGACAFLLRLPTSDLCGLGPLAPASCRSLAGAPVGPYAGDEAEGAAERQAALEARWRERVAHRPFPLDPETALDGILALTGEEP